MFLELKVPLKRVSQSNIALGAPIFCSRHQRVNINENQIFSKCSVIKWKTFIRKSFEKKLFPLGEKMEKPLKKALPKQYCFGRAHFLFQTPEGQKKSNFIHPQDKGPRGTTFKKKKKHQKLLLFCVNAKNEKSGFIALGVIFGIQKVDRDKLMNNNLNFQIRYYSPHIGVTFYKENVMHIIITFGVRGEIEPKNGPSGPLKKTE